MSVFHGMTFADFLSFSDFLTLPDSDRVICIFSLLSHLS